MAKWFDLIPEMIAIGNGHKLLRINERWVVETGWSTGEVLEMQWVTLIHPHDVAPTIDFTKDVGETLKCGQIYNRYRRKDGTYMWLDWITAPPTDGLLYSSARVIRDDNPILGSLALIADERAQRFLEDTGGSGQ